MELSKELSDAMAPHNLIRLNVFGFDMSITDTVIITWVIMAVLISLALFFTRRLELVPTGKQRIAETLVEQLNSLFKTILGYHWRTFTPYLGTILLFLLFANIISIFDIIPNWEQLYQITGWKVFENLPQLSIRPPTKDINVTVSMALMSIIIVIGAGIKFKEFPGWLRSFIEPMPGLLPMKILEYFVRIISLSLRLFGNIIGAFIIMELIYSVVSNFMPPVLIPAVFSIYFDLFDGALQACIFVFLTSLYISEAVE